MKKYGILGMMLLLIVTGVSAVTGNTCDVNGNGSPDLEDAAYLSQAQSWYNNNDMRFDWNNDGELNLLDVSLFSSLVNTYGWCNEVLYPLLTQEPEEPEPQPTTVINKYYSGGGSGLSESTFWYRLTGKYGLHKLYDNFIDYLKTIFVTKKDMQDMQYGYENKLCKLLNEGNPKGYDSCLGEAITSIYGEGCEWEWINNEKVMVCP